MWRVTLSLHFMMHTRQMPFEIKKCSGAALLELHVTKTVSRLDILSPFLWKHKTELLLVLLCNKLQQQVAELPYRYGGWWSQSHGKTLPNPNNGNALPNPVLGKALPNPWPRLSLCCVGRLPEYIVLLILSTPASGTGPLCGDSVN